MLNEALDQFAVEWRPLAALAPYAKNARTHSAEQLERLAGSLREFGWMRPLLITAAGEVIAGHGALQAALKLGLEEAPCAVRDHLSPEQVKAYRLADNQLALLAGWDDQLLGRELRNLVDVGYDIALTGFGIADLDEILRRATDGAAAEPSASLDDPFLAPAVTVFDARQGWWQARKRAWIDLGIRSELGRGGTAPGGSLLPAAQTVAGKTRRGDGREGG